MNYKGKTIIACPECSGRMRIPVSDTPLRVKCPFCGEQFRHEPDPAATRERMFGGGGPQAFFGRIRTEAQRAVNSFAAWPPGRKLFLYIAALALVITVLSNRAPAPVVGMRYDTEAKAQEGKKYLLEDPGFIALLQQRAGARVFRR